MDNPEPVKVDKMDTNLNASAEESKIEPLRGTAESFTICKACYKRNSADAKFCNQCGTELPH
jgi:rRNA maturation endonuclease Nob1